MSSKLHIFHPPDIRRGFNYDGRFAVCTNKIRRWDTRDRKRIQFCWHSWGYAYGATLTVWGSGHVGREFHVSLVKMPEEVRVALMVQCWELEWKVRKVFRHFTSNKGRQS